MISFDEFYKRPLHLDDYGETVFTDEDKYAFHFYVSIDINEARHVVDIINDKCESDLSHKFIYRDGIIYKDKFFVDNEYIYLASWEELLAICNGDTRKTSKIQNEFGNYLIKKLNANEKE